MSLRCADVAAADSLPLLWLVVVVVVDVAVVAVASAVFVVVGGVSSLTVVVADVVDIVVADAAEGLPAGRHFRRMASWSGRLPLPPSRLRPANRSKQIITARDR